MSLTVDELMGDLHWHPSVLDIPPPKLTVLGWDGGVIFKCRWSKTKECFVDPKGKKVNVWMWKVYK